MKYESIDDRNKSPSVKEYLDKIKPFLRDMIINLQKFNTWKIHLAITINFMFSKNIYEEHVMHSKSDYKIYVLW